MYGDSVGEGKDESSPPKRACRRYAIKPNSIEAEQLAEFSMNIVLSQTSIDACDESKAEMKSTSTNSDSDSDSNSDTEDENDTSESKNDQQKYSDDFKSDSKISTDNNTDSKDVDTKVDGSK